MYHEVCSLRTRLKSAVSGSFLQVVAQVNNGNGDFMVSVKPKASLCDGMFHKISGKMHKDHFMKDKRLDSNTNVNDLNHCLFVF